MISTADHNGSLQDAVTAAITSGQDVYCPTGKIKPVDDTVKIELFKDGTYRQVSLVIQGDARFWDMGNNSVLRATFKDKPIIGIHKGKGVEIKGLNIQGPSGGATTGKDERFDLASAISIDYLDPRKKGDNSRGGSTGCLIDNCTLNNTVSGISISVNGYTQNGDNMRFSNIRFQNHKYAFVGCQAQEKNNNFYNVGSWSNVGTFFQFGTHGERSCGYYTADNIFLAGNVDRMIYRNTSGWEPMHISRLFAENIKEIGYWNTTRKDSIRDSSIKFRNGQFPNQHLTGSGVRFTNVTMNHYDSTVPVLLASQNNIYDNCDQEDFANAVLGRYNNPHSNPDYNNGYSTKEIGRFTANVTEQKMQVTGVNTGDIILFTRMGDLAWSGMGQVTEPGVINYISPGINNGEKYDLWKYQSN